MISSAQFTPTQGGTRPIQHAAQSSLQMLEETLVEKKWNERWKDNIDAFLPNNCLQTSLDEFGHKIEELLQPAHQFSNWIDRSEDGWFTNLSLSLVKLPLAAVRNILRMIYNVAKALVYMAVHPIKFLVDALHFLTELIKSLAKPETYTKLGAGIVGSSLAQMVFTGGLSPHVYMGLALGGALIGLGLIAGVIVALVKGESVGHTAWKQIKAIPECMLTGFLIGLAVGALKQLFTEKHVVMQNDPAHEFVDQYLQSLPKHYPAPTSVEMLPDGTIIASWKGADLTQLAHADPTLMSSITDFKQILEFHGDSVQWYNSIVKDFNLTFYRPDNLTAHYSLHYPPYGTTNIITSVQADPLPGSMFTGFEQHVYHPRGVHYPAAAQLVSGPTTTTPLMPEWVPYVSGSAAILKPSNE